MANFLIVIDPDESRRSRFLETAKPHLALTDGLRTGVCASGDFLAGWACHQSAPVQHEADENGAAVIWGEPIHGAEAQRMDATTLRALWRLPLEPSPEPMDGYHAAAAFDSSLGLVVGADLLGLYPVYYWAQGDVLLVGASPELFRHHPLFSVQFNPRGLVNIFLTMHLFENETLLRGVQRLGAGNLLTWRPGRMPAEINQYRLQPCQRYFDVPFYEQVGLLAEVLDKAVTRQVASNGRCCLMLSGGIDSRLLAGYLKEKQIPTTALTLGVSSDIDMQCARGVAQALDFPHHAVNVGYDEYVRCALLCVRWEHLANGFNGMMRWGVFDRLAPLAPRVVTGHVLDAVIGTRFIRQSYSPSTRSLSFEGYFARLNHFGFPPETLKRMFRQDVFGEMVEDAVARIRSQYERYGELESQRVWCFNLYHRQRFHVGSTAWANSFGSWPVMLALDRQLLDLASGLPATSLADRLAEEHLLCERFPSLAALPLDRADYNTEPLRPGLRWQIASAVRGRIAPVAKRLRGKQPQKESERRYYNRVYDFNHAGWLAVRQLAEPSRARMGEFFERAELDKLLPPPEQGISLGDDLRSFSGLKSLTAFLIWSRDHLN